jgi:TolA-binding protein
MSTKTLLLLAGLGAVAYFLYTRRQGVTSDRATRMQERQAQREAWQQYQHQQMQALQQQLQNIQGRLPAAPVTPPASTVSGMWY